MVKRPIYLQFCAIVVASLFAFAAIAYFVVSLSGHDRYEAALFQKTSTLASLLLPDADARSEEQQRAIEEISAALDFEITLWGADGQLIGSTSEPVQVSPAGLEPGNWSSNVGSTSYTTVLDDGRGIVVNLNRIAALDDSHEFGLSFLLLAVLIALAAYPIIRQTTRRLERLQHGVERIGSGNLSARVAIEGNDEVALVASSFNKAADQIESLINGQRLLLANASHELRTPLTRIRMGIEMLQKKDDSDRRAALKDDIREIDQLIDELIMMTRLDTATEPYQFESVHLMAIAAEEAVNYENCRVSGDAAELFGSRRMLQHLIRNLLDNAHIHGASPVEIAICSGQSSIELIVTDSGDGISDEDRPHIFEPFYRGRDRQNVKGSGLGLALVHKIAEAHGGDVRVKRAPLSSVHIIFPKSQDGL